MVYLGLFAGFVILLLSGDFLVRGAIVLAMRLGVPSLIIGLTVVAFGTSAPELVVSVRAILSGSSGIALGNIVGSNIANILLVLGLPALICPTDCDQPLIKRNMFYVIAASILFIVLCFNGPLITWHGAILFSLIVLFLIESGRRMGSMSNSVTKDDTALEQIDGVAGLPNSAPALVMFLIIGILGLPIGAEVIVSNATEIARAFDVSEAAIGLTLIALGTSLPELSTTFVAALRGHCGLALGNVLGSNLFNILAVMGVTAMMAPVAIPETFLHYDLWVMLAATLAITPFVMMRARITRIPATLFICAYGIYVYFVFAPNFATLTTAMH